MPLTLHQTINQSNLAANLSSFSAFLEHVMILSNNSSKDTYQELKEIDQILADNLKTTGDYVENNAQSISVNWLYPIRTSVHYRYSNSQFKKNSQIVIGSPKEIATIVQNLKPLTDKHAISLIISNHPVSTKLSQSYIFETYTEEIATIVHKLTQSQTLINELLSSKSMTQLSLSEMESTSLIDSLPLLAQTGIKDNFAYNHALIYVSQIFTWLNEIS